MGDTGDGSLRPQFGNRHLVDKARVFDHNAWDNVVWDDDLKDDAEQKIQVNSAEVMNKDKQDEYEKNASLYWNDFYCVHDNKFFKDRHWLFTEFSELAPKGALSEHQTKLTDDTDVGAHGDTSKSDDEKGVLFEQLHDLTVTSPSIYPGANAGFKILEAGCGVGNTVFPILQVNNNPDLFIYCCDFAKSAIEIVKEHELYDPSRCYAFPCDISDEEEVFPFPENSLDVIVLIFVLSAIQPSRMQPTVKRLCQYLKPGGLLLFRDYGRYDMAQLRFKKGRCLSDNFYVRGDGTRVYFFTQDELDQMLTECGLIKEQNHIDRRLQINRGKQLKMYRDEHDKSFKSVWETWHSDLTFRC